jgi:hypothetical protein
MLSDGSPQAIYENCRTSAIGARCSGDDGLAPSENELAGARYQGRVIAETANKLHG